MLSVVAPALGWWLRWLYSVVFILNGIRTMKNLLNIKVPKNNSAAMQLIQLYAQSGHVFWTAGEIERHKLRRFLPKLAGFRIDRDATGRTYDKTKGVASCHLVVLPMPEPAQQMLAWVLVSTSGKSGLADPDSPKLGPVSDTRLRGQHLRWKHYELLHAEKKIEVYGEHGKKTIRDTTWTWRMTAQRYREHEAFIVDRVRHRDANGVNSELQALAMMPMFSGIRGQRLKLFMEAKKLADKFGLAIAPVPELPFMTKQPIYTEPPGTLFELV